MHEDGVALFHGRRLTLPEDAEDRQPLSAGHLRLVADARIDNRAELAAQLGQPHIATAPDSWAILAAWARWGEAAAERLIGDFAFVIWDGRTGRLTCARDAMGSRAVFFHRGQGFVAVASLPHGVTALPEAPMAARRGALIATLALTPPKETESLFAGVERLPPGCLLSIDGGRTSLRPFRRFDLSRRISYSRDQDYVEAARERLDEAVRAVACAPAARSQPT